MRHPKHSVFRLAAILCVAWPVAAGAPPAWGESAGVRRVEGLEAPGFHANGMPEKLLPAGDRFVYVARSGAPQAPSRLLLWASDGSKAGTEILRELCAGCGISASASTGKVAFFAVCEDYGCYDDRGESRLWRSDGSRSGTFPLTLPFRGYVHELVVAGDFAYLLACSSQCSVTTSDGTVEGTRPLDIPGLGAWTDSLTAWKDEAYLSSEDSSAAGATLWRLSARRGEAERLRDFPFEPCLAAVPSIDRLLLVLGSDLWVSDGTSAGTTLLRHFQDIDNPPVGDCVIADRGGRAWFVASEKKTGEQLWSTDGTHAGTRRATNLSEGLDLFSFGYRSTHDNQFARVGTRFLFPVSDRGGRRLLWTTNGFWRSARPVDGCRGGCPEVVAAQPFAPLGRRVAFIGQRPGEPVAMWITDGTGRGTVKVLDAPEAVSGLPEYLLPWVTTREGRWYLSAPADPESTSWTPTNRLWASDGSRAGTVALATIEGVDEAGKLESMLLGRAGRVYFPGCARGDCGLLATDGRAAGAVRTVTFEAESALSGVLARAGSHALLLASDASFWLADATAATPLPESATGYFEMEENWALEAVANRDRTFVHASYWRSASSGDSFWSTDGTAAGTTVLLEGFSSTVSRMAPWRDGRSALFFSSRYTSTGRRVADLGATDGTAAGTVRFARLPANLYPGALITHGAVALLVLSPSGSLENESRLWISDGTAAGTRELTSAFATLDTPVVLGERAYALASRADGGPILLVVDLASRAVSEVALAPLGAAHAAELTAAAGRLWLTARAADETEQSLWVSDGTPAGTQRLAVTLAPRPLTATGVSPLVTALDGAVYFNADDAVHGRELWRSDGAGAALVADLAPGLASGAPRSNIVAWGGRLYFAADDGVHGQELWSTDGTAAGTRLKVDLAAGPTGSSPADLTVAGDHLFFAAADGVSGWQVWVMDQAPVETGRSPDPAP